MSFSPRYLTPARALKPFARASVTRNPSTFVAARCVAIFIFSVVFARRDARARRLARSNDAPKTVSSHSSATARDWRGRRRTSRRRTPWRVVPRPRAPRVASSTRDDASTATRRREWRRGSRGRALKIRRVDGARRRRRARRGAGARDARRRSRRSKYLQLRAARRERRARAGVGSSSCRDF